MNNKELGELVGVSFSMASRLQSGDRTPGIDTMQKIAQVFDFPLDAQVVSRENGSYHSAFAKAIANWERDHQPAVEIAAAAE